MMPHKHMPVRTMLDLPEGAIDHFICEAFIDSTILPDLPPAQKGRIVLNWPKWNNRSSRDSIRIQGGFMMMPEDTISDPILPVEIFDYHMRCRAWDRYGNYAEKTVRNIPWGTYWFAVDMRSAFPEVTTDTASTGELVFDIDGEGDVYVVELFYNYSDTLAGIHDFKRFWKGITQDDQIILPDLPPPHEVFPLDTLTNPSYVYYRLTTFVDPDFDINDPNIDNIVEKAISESNLLYVPEPTIQGEEIKTRHRKLGRRLEL